MLRRCFAGMMIILGIWISADVYQMYLFDFEDFWWTSFAVTEEIDIDKMISDVFGTAPKYGLELFYVEKDISGWHTNISIYCEETVREILETRYKILEGTSESLFSGDSSIHYFDLSELNSIRAAADLGEYYLIGVNDDSALEQQVFGYKQELFEEYGGDLRKLEGNKLSNCYKKLAWICGVIIFVTCAMTIYHVMWIKKTLAIRISLGESASKIVFTEYLSDVMVYSLIHIIGIECLKNAYGVICFNMLLNICFVGLLLIVLLIYLSLFAVDFRKGLSHVMLNEKLLGICFGIKVMMVVLLSVSLSTSFVLIFDYVKLIEQRTFYENRYGYNHLILYGEDIGVINALYNKFIRQNYISCNIQFIGDLYQYGSLKDEVAIYANSNMAEYLCSKFSSETELIMSAESCLLIPYNMVLSELELDELYRDALSYVHSDSALPAVIQYIEDVNIVCMGNSGEHLLKKNPIIIYCNVPDSERHHQEYIPSYNFQYAILQCNESELQSFCDSNGCKYRLIDVYDDYMKSVNSIKRGALINLIFLLFQICSEIVLSISLIQLDFKANGIERVIKKLFGYSLIERMGAIPKIIFFTGVISILSTLLLYRLLGLTGLVGALCVDLFFMIMELVIFIVVFLKFENEKMLRSLKHGDI